MPSSERGPFVRRLGRTVLAGAQSLAVPAGATGPRRREPAAERTSGNGPTSGTVGEDGGAGEGGPQRKRRHFIPRPLRHAVLAFLVLLVIEYFVWPTLSAGRKNLGLLARVNVFWMLAGVALEAGSLFAYALLTRAVLPKEAPDLWTITRIDMSTFAASHVIPGGTASSTGLGYRLLTSAGVRGEDAGFALGSQGIGSAVVLNVLLWLALVISIPIDGVHKTYVTVALVGMLLLLFFGGLIYLLTIGESVAARVLRAVARPIPRVNGDQVEAVVQRIGQRLRDLASDRERLRYSVIWAAANWILDAACLWCFVAAFGRFISPIDLFVAYGVGNVLAAIPITPGGLGIVEAAVTAALVGFGLGKGTATLAVIGWRLVQFWLPIPVGAGMYVSLRVEKSLLRMRGREALEELRHMPALATPVEAPVETPAGTPAAAEPVAPASYHDG